MKDLTAYLTPALTLKLGDKVYTVPPPCQSAGLRLAAIIEVSHSQVDGKSVPPGMQALFDEIDLSTGIGTLSLTPRVVEQMESDGIPGPDVNTAAQYALYYWVLGEEMADSLMAAQAGGEQGPKASRTGPSTASGSPTKTASTPGTATRRRTSAPKGSAKAAASPGASSSTTGP